VEIEIKQSIKKVGGDYLAGQVTATIDGEPVAACVAERLLLAALANTEGKADVMAGETKKAEEAMPDEVVKVGTVQSPPAAIRWINDHKGPGCNDHIEIMAAGVRSRGNAQSHYEVVLMKSGEVAKVLAELDFMSLPVSETDGEPNGVTDEALLAVVVDRLRSFQGGEFRCRESAIAITKLEEALHWLDARSKDRKARAVEGTYQE
jgi:hypothetical protein